MGLIVTLIVGGIAGWLTGLLMKGGGYGLIGNIILGVIGGIVGGWIGSLITGADLVNGFNLTSILVSVLGAALVVFIARLIRRA
ncbi:MAG: GlsB/YeaQ/YmgE family stress response membrane protein [Thermoflexales bacterium]|nr:GlsB/YeaQ/YmgE family stress response membrane protein [Thermoflexales bacterium]